ncbi:ATP-dependent nuclease [Rubrobacter marinus]|nr:AAA family ATPase [Rubrobacter marinus]
MVERAFKETRIKLDYSNLSTLCLRVGKNFAGVSDDPRDARPLLGAFDKLEEQGDGMRSFVTTALSLLVGSKPVLLLDEPEAFLHPPQAFQLGAIIAEQTNNQRQLIVATHSVDLLRGILSRTTDVDLIRLSRGVGGMRVNRLGSEEVKEITNHPLLSSTRVLDGLFYKGVVVVEADSDSAFYQRVARMKRPGDEIHYTHAHNKQTLYKVVGPYKRMGVEVAAVPDFDILKEQSELRSLLGAATDDDTSEVLDAQKCIKNEIESHPVTEQLKQLRAQLDKLANKPSVNTEETEAKALNDLKRNVKAAVKDSSLWTRFKQEGREALSEEGTRYFDLVNEFCKMRGVFMVPVGELESWMVPYGLERMSKNHWIVRALELLGDIDLPDDSDLAEFVTEVHDYLLES